jgi:alpha-glucosidase
MPGKVVQQRELQRSERTPMQWTPGPQAGFSTNPQTWLPVVPDYKTVNVQAESGVANSLLGWNEKLIALRRTNAALHNGALTMLDTGPNVLAYTRKAAGTPEVVVAMNMSASEQTVVVDGATTTLAQSDAGTRFENGKLVLPAFSAWIGKK